MESNTELEKILTPLLDGMGLMLVEMSVGRHRGNIKVNMVLYKEGGISLDDLTAAQKTLRPRLELEFDREDLSVEISSPGMGRVIKNPREYGIFIGRGIRILREDDWTSGTIKGSDGDAVTISTDEGDVSIPITIIRKAKLD